MLYGGRRWQVFRRDENVIHRAHLATHLVNRCAETGGASRLVGCLLSARDDELTSETLCVQAKMMPPRDLGARQLKASIVLHRITCNGPGSAEASRATCCVGLQHSSREASALRALRYGTGEHIQSLVRRDNPPRPANRNALGPELHRMHVGPPDVILLHAPAAARSHPGSTGPIVPSVSLSAEGGSMCGLHDRPQCHASAHPTLEVRRPCGR